VTFLLESPWPILLIGIAVEAVLAIQLLRTGQGRILGWMLGTGVLLLMGLVVERLIVTERESVENTIDAAVAAAQRNDLNGLLACVSPKAPKTQADSRWVLGTYQFRHARISNLEITLNRLTSPPTAKAKFLAYGAGQHRQTTYIQGNFARWVTVNLRKENGRWMLADYTVEDLPMP
jgi:hypothetical protein